MLAADGFVRIRNQVSNLCLGVQGGDSHRSAALVEVYHCSGQGDPRLDNQCRIVPQNDGTKRIENRVSVLCPGVQGADRHGPGTQVEVFDCNTRRFPARDQHWRFWRACSGLVRREGSRAEAECVVCALRAPSIAATRASCAT